MSREVVTEGALQACARDHNYLEHILKRKGVMAFDPSTPAGKEVLDLFEAFAAASNPRRDEIVRLQGVELAVEAVLLRRSLMTQIFQIRRFDPRHTKAGGARRSTFAAAIAAWNTASQQLERACKMMGIEGYAQLDPAADDQASLKELLRKKAHQQAAEKAVDAEFSPVEEASSTTGVDPGSADHPDGASPASAEPDASSVGGDARAATPDSPAPRSRDPHPGIVEGLKMAQALRQGNTPETPSATRPQDAPATDSPATPDE